MADEYIKKSDAQKLVLTIVGKLFSEEFDIKQEIQKIPSADVAEVRHGKWIKPTSDPYTMLAKCSVCGFDLGFITNFCANCGADMRGE